MAPKAEGPKAFAQAAASHLRPFRYFRIFHLDSPEHVDEIIRRYFHTQFGNDKPGWRILELLCLGAFRRRQNACGTVVVEEHYFDRDHFAGYNRIYSHSYRSVRKTTDRVHFFSKRIEIEDLASLESCSSDYLGYSVVRPTEAFRVGRTVVSPPECSEEDHILGQSTFEVNVAGSKLTIRGVPFMEQDTQVAACATACLWMVSEAMAARYGRARLSTTEITELATRYSSELGRPIPSVGLSDNQILEAVRALGYEPLVFCPVRASDAQQILYWYVESEIPVVLLLSTPGGSGEPGHVVVTIGHGYRTGVDVPAAPFSRTHPDAGTALANTRWVPCFLVHDDQRGPYRRMGFLADRGDGIVRVAIDAGSATNIPQGPFDWLDSLHITGLDGMVIPLPGPFSVDAEMADRRARRLLLTARDLLGSPEIRDIVLRTYLIPSNEFKRRIDPAVDQHSFAGMGEVLRVYYRSKPLPNYIWLTEISNRAWMNAPLGERLIHGEILIDPFSSPHGAEFLTMHVPGYLAEMPAHPPWAPLEIEQSDKRGRTPPVIDSADAAVRALANAYSLADDRPYTQLARVAPLD